MQEFMNEMIRRGKELLSGGAVQRVLGWKKGDLGYNPEPAFFLENRIWTNLCMTASAAPI